MRVGFYAAGTVGKIDTLTRTAKHITKKLGYASYIAGNRQYRKLFPCFPTNFRSVTAVS